eukprot:CAMPEP_0201545624 /NCGR_PEP_ID=MMETSP0173_2-20130828/2078_1 /ASSEMBLY_ACC=CAM_ASM_000268 /TAXON_ID=218659 /ORGANISM="Vexillifera sp., Strain DIVA3 564/2" /LENGTH=318 /DNA_ID=CAMNT_0047954067 /DNA_START=41 /DNA_END=997 /DNA_ORIENTATION=-
MTVPNIEAHGLMHWLKLGVVGFTAGAVGQLSIYPADTVKTRLQAQARSGRVMYAGNFDCLRQIIRTEGFFSLYRGVTSVALLTSPEKALKLGANDFFRHKFKEWGLIENFERTSDQREADGSGRIVEDERLTYSAEMLAGAGAGFTQMVITCPMEIVKIQLQMEGQKHAKQSKGVMGVAKELGLRGLYKGATSTWLRDVPFSLIYFPLFHRWKAYAKEQTSDGQLSPLQRFVIPTGAGLVAATFVTPMDVVKTRMQAPDCPYTGNLNCIQQTWRHEGFRAFWIGLPARILTRGPQFGITLLCYEMLQSLFMGGIESES